MSKGGVHETSIGLLSQIRAGEEPAWRRLIGLYEPLLRYWCRRSGVEEADLDDLCQEVWLAVGPTLRGYRPDPGGSFRAWLRGIAHHKSQHWHTRRLRQPAEAQGGSGAIHRLELAESSLDDDSNCSDPEERVAYRELYRRALALVRGQFEERTWAAFVATTIDGRPAADVGIDLGMSTAAVRMAKSRVLSRIREELGDLID